MAEQELIEAMTTELGKGGDFIPDAMADEYFTFITDQAWGRRLFRVVPMPTETYKFPKITGGTNAYFVRPGRRATVTGMSTDQFILKAKRLMVATAIDEVLLDSSKVDFMDIVEKDFARALAEGEDLAIWQGDPTHTAEAQKLDEATEENWYVDDPRLTATGIYETALQHPENCIDLAGGDITKDTYKMLIKKMGLFAKDKNQVIGTVGPSTGCEVADMDAFNDASIYGNHTALWTGEIGKMKGIRTVTPGACPEGCLIMTPRWNVLVGDRKKYKFRTDTDIFSENVAAVTSERIDVQYAFPEAIVMAYNGAE